MSRGPCDGCGNDTYIDLEIRSRLPIEMIPNELQFCEACGAFIAGYLSMVMRLFAKFSSSSPEPQKPLSWVR